MGPMMNLIVKSAAILFQFIQSASVSAEEDLKVYQSLWAVAPELSPNFGDGRAGQAAAVLG
jgi:hypothetical protein